MKHKFLILIIAVCIFEVNSWPQRGGHWRGRGNRDPEVSEQDSEKNGDEESKEENSGNERRFNRHRPGLISSFLEPGQFPNNLHQAIREGLTIPGRIIGKSGLFGGRGGNDKPDRPSRPHNHPKTDSTSEKTSSTSTSTSTTAASSTTSSPTSKPPSSTTSSTTKQLETNPPEFTFKLPTDDKFDLDNKGPTTEKIGNGTDSLNQRRLINAPDRCQDDALGNCREAF